MCAYFTQTVAQGQSVYPHALIKHVKHNAKHGQRAQNHENYLQFVAGAGKSAREWAIYHAL